MLKKDTNPFMKIVNPRAFKFSIQSQIEEDLNDRRKYKHINLPSLSKKKIKLNSTEFPITNTFHNTIKSKIFEIYQQLNQGKSVEKSSEKLTPKIININQSLFNLPALKSTSRNHNSKKNDLFSPKQSKLNQKNSLNKKSVDVCKTYTLENSKVKKDENFNENINRNFSKKEIQFYTNSFKLKSEKKIIKLSQIKSFSKHVSINQLIDDDFHFYSET